MTRTGLIRRAAAARRVRVAITAVGVASCTLLVLLLFSVSRGLTSGVAAYVGQEGADLWVGPRGSDNLIRNSGLVSLATVGWLDSLAGVARADPVLRGFVTAVSAVDTTRRLNLLAVAFRAPDGTGGPTRLVQGTRPVEADEVTLDRAAAWRLGVRPPDSVTLNGAPFRVTGVSERTNLIATQFAFVDLGGAERLGALPGAASFLALELDRGAAADDVAARIANRDPGLAGFPRDAFVSNNVREVAAGFRPMQRLLSLVGFLIAAIFVGLLVHAAAEDRRREIAILLAMGASAAEVARGMLSEVGALVLAGGVAGAAATLLLSRLLRRLVPTLELAPDLSDAVVVVPVFVLVGLLAAAIPLARLRKVDPVEAFRP